MSEPWIDWLGWAVVFIALLAFAYFVHAFIGWIDDRRNR